MTRHGSRWGALGLALVLWGCGGSSTPGGTTDFGRPDAKGPDVADSGSDADATVPDTAPDAPLVDALGCNIDADCTGRLGVLGPCEIALCQAARCVKGQAGDGQTCNDKHNCTTNDQCVAGLCKGTPVICDQPPPAECKDDATRVTYAAQGACGDDGKCAYPPTEVVCSQGCQGGQCVGNPCEGMTCDIPPNECFAQGSCVDGSCTYPYQDGKACGAAASCDTQGTCASGVCIGAATTCVTPPPDECVNGKDLLRYDAVGVCNDRAGTCSYPTTPRTCVGTCLLGACSEDLRLKGVALTVAGGAMAGGQHVMSCVMPGWFQSATVQGGQYRLSTGFEP